MRLSCYTEDIFSVCSGETVCGYIEIERFLKGYTVLWSKKDFQAISSGKLSWRTRCYSCINLLHGNKKALLFFFFFQFSRVFYMHNLGLNFIKYFAEVQELEQGFGWT